MSGGTTVEDTRHLDLETMDILRGTSELRNRLLLEMSTGTPAVTDMAYAVKVRIKEDYKIVEKVRKKRLTKPQYSVRDLRDVLGLRIVTLYRLDALRIIPALLDKIGTTGSDPHAVFVPNSLEEVVIYSTNPKGDAQGLVSRIQEIFSTRGLKRIVRVEDVPSNYTSIHMVTWCRGKYRDGYRTIPVEIQVRTALEDVWSEIDHSLKYKREATDRRGTPLGLSEEGRLQSSLSHLSVMKTLVDGIAQYADQIKIQLDEMDDHRIRSSRSKQAEDALSRIEPLPGLPIELKAAVVHALRQSNAIIDGRGSGLSAPERQMALRRILSEFDTLRVDLRLAGDLPAETATELHYIVEAERALLLFEIGNRLESGTPLLAEASKAYAELLARFPERSILRYRHAKVLDAMGDRDTAIAILRDALLRIDEDPALAVGHWLRFASRRVLGVLLWERGEALRRSGATGGENLPRGEERLALFLEAYLVTRDAYEMTQVLGDGEEASANSQAERAKAANNLLWFALEYLDAGGERARLEENGFNAETIGRLLTEMESGPAPNRDDERVLDTARRAYEHVGDREKARAIAARIVESYNKARIERADPQDEEMLRAALATLSGD